jgi:hypothetical protein
MENLPFCEQVKDGYHIRKFKSTLKEEDLKWHYDDEDRIMEITHPTDWKFQYDNQLPINLVIYKQYYIPKGQYHRLIKGSDDLEVKILKLKPIKEKKDFNGISGGLQYHLDNGLTISDSVYRIGSDAWCNLVNEVRELYFEGKIELDMSDKALILTDAGKKGIFEGELVPLDAPFPINELEYAVFIKEDNKIKRIVFK